MHEFGVPKKLILLRKMCMNSIRYQIRMDCTFLKKFKMMTRLSVALSLILFNVTLEKVICSTQNNKLEINISRTSLDVLKFGDNLNLVG